MRKEGGGYEEDGGVTATLPLLLHPLLPSLRCFDGKYHQRRDDDDDDFDTMYKRTIDTLRCDSTNYKVGHWAYY